MKPLSHFEIQNIRKYGEESSYTIELSLRQFHEQYSEGLFYRYKARNSRPFGFYILATIIIVLLIICINKSVICSAFLQ
jgi:hypothetical protein